MSPERSQQVGLKMAIASSLLYMFFIGKMCAFFFNMLKQQQLGYILYVQTNPYGHATRVPPLTGLFQVTFCLKPVDIRSCQISNRWFIIDGVFIARFARNVKGIHLFPKSDGFQISNSWMETAELEKTRTIKPAWWSEHPEYFYIVSVSNVSTFGSSEASFLVDKINIFLKLLKPLADG